MGIPGLTTYIAKRSEQYFESFDLHDTYLAIDGCSIGCQLYTMHTKSNCALGGDYNEYALCVRKFFTSLQKCNVTPLVILDGSYTGNKRHTIMKRRKDKMNTAAFYTPLSQKTLKFLPPLIIHVFISVLKEMKISYVRCLSEADSAIAAVAKYINCPVLSYDSDFYIYGVLYIPFSTIETDVTRKSGGYVKRCQIYRVTSLLNSFPGLDESRLLLAAILLGNDYIEQSVFTDFYKVIKSPRVKQLNHNIQQCRIEAILHWLSNHTLPTALDMIMNKISHNNKKQVLKLIKSIIEEYTNMSTDILIPLGFSEEDIVRIASQNVQNNSNTRVNINYLEIIEKLATKLGITDIGENKQDSELKAFVSSLPTWYIEECYKGLVPSFSLSLLMGDSYICYVQIEDFHQPSSIFMSLEIMNVIFTLLKSGFEENDKCGQYITRGENNELTQYALEYVSNIFPYDIPSLHDLQKTSLTKKREIFDITLKIDRRIDEFPINWRLYIATTKYWVDHLTNVRCDSHIYALLLAMLHHIINEKIGYYRSMHKFETKYKEKLQKLESTMIKKPIDLSYSTQMSIMQALDLVTVDDCILLAPFFIEYSQMNQELYTNPKTFRIRIVHLFALFQCCIEHSFSLNAILGFPYEETLISNMYCGTLLYNLCNKFHKCSNIENYINTKLQCSPSLLQLFNIILIKAKQMFNIYPTKRKNEKR